MNTSFADLQRQAAALGYDLVPKPRGNWHPVFVRLIHEDRIFFAVKLWAEVTGNGLRTANAQIAAIRNHNFPMPVGTEYGDITQTRLDYYEHNPWQERV